MMQTKQRAPAVLPTPRGRPTPGRGADMADGICSIEGCESGGKLRRGWCGRHYTRWYIHGEPTALLKASNGASLAERLNRRLVRRDGCLVWTGSTTTGGYGRVAAPDGTLKLAHRAAWELANGPIPDGMDILHRCDNPPCADPEHLFLGDDSDNQQDARHKGRRGSDKLTPDDVRAIREQYAAGVQGKVLAPLYGVSRATISLVVNRKAWRDV